MVTLTPINEVNIRCVICNKEISPPNKKTCPGECRNKAKKEYIKGYMTKYTQTEKWKSYARLYWLRKKGVSCNNIPILKEGDLNGIKKD